MYIIVGTHEFYGPETREIVVEQMTEDGKIIKFFPTREAAEAMIVELDAERYVLKHNESGRPEYRVEDESYEDDCA